eukprot:scaffold5838_cov106-Skeletonema_dohrnii-CCMP3373.AAC.4
MMQSRRAITAINKMSSTRPSSLTSIVWREKRLIDVQSGGENIVDVRGALPFAALKNPANTTDVKEGPQMSLCTV